MSRSLRAGGPQPVLLSYEGKADGALVRDHGCRSVLRPAAEIGSGTSGAPSNMLIRGDNIDALACLMDLPDVAGSVRLVYIDPPFATGQEFRSGRKRSATISASRKDPVAYDDRLSGAAFLEFLRRRLILLRELLADDGSIYLHLDARMGHYVKVLMDEIFGRDRFINDITRIKCNPKNFSRRGYGNIKDMILFYSKSARYVWNEPRVDLTGEDVERLFPKRDRNGRRYATTPLHAPGETRNGNTGKPWNGMPPPAGRHWRVPPRELERLEALALIEWSSSGNPRKKIFADQAAARGKKMQDVWEFKDPPYPRYPTEKNVDLLTHIISASSNPGDLVLDCFAGSGTTLLAAEALGRRWIGVDQSAVAMRTMKRRLAGASSFRIFQCEPAPALAHRNSLRRQAGTPRPGISHGA